MSACLLLQVIELDLAQLPEGEEVLGILTNEKVPLNYWVDLAVSHIGYSIYLLYITYVVTSEDLHITTFSLCTQWSLYYLY